MKTWLFRGLIAFLLLAPYRLDRKKNGGFTLRAVLYELDYDSQGGKTRCRISFLKILERQCHLLKGLAKQ